MILEGSYIGNLAIQYSERGPSIIEYELTHRLHKFVTKTSACTGAFTRHAQLFIQTKISTVFHRIFSG